MRRFIQMTEPPYDLIEVGADYAPLPRQRADGTLWNDRSYEGLRASDGTDISSRTKHREYMKRHGLTTADDFKGQWAKAEQARNEYRTSGKGGAITRRDIAAVVERLEKL